MTFFPLFHVIFYLADLDKSVRYNGGNPYSKVPVWRIIGALGFSNQKPDRRKIERDDAHISSSSARLTLPFKKSPREGRIIVFVGESDLNGRHRGLLEAGRFVLIS